MARYEARTVTSKGEGMTERASRKIVFSLMLPMTVFARIVEEYVDMDVSTTLRQDLDSWLKRSAPVAAQSLVNSWRAFKSQALLRMQAVANTRT